MSIRAIAAAAGLGLFAAACNQPSPEPAQPEQPSVADQPAPAAEDAAFAQALNYECQGGGKLDIALNQGQDAQLLARLDAAAAVKLPIDAANQTGMSFTDGTTTISFEDPGVVYKSGATTRACTFVSRSLPPPAVDGVVRALTEADAGAAITMKTGEKISIALSGVPTAGYLWAASSPPAFVKASDGPGGATSSSQFLPGFTGGNHWEVIVIEALAKGEGEITLAQRRPWEDKAEPDADTFKFKLKVD
jgi:predicted secreted protein